MKKIIGLLGFIIGSIGHGMINGVRYIANEFNLPMWLGWIIAILTMPINIACMLVLVIVKRRYLIESLEEIYVKGEAE
jgi:uncharacterized membrane protein YkvI